MKKTYFVAYAFVNEQGMLSIANTTVTTSLKGKDLFEYIEDIVKFHEADAVILSINEL